MTVAPHSTANWIAACPTDPEPACSSRVSRDPTARERSAWYAVPTGMPRAAPSFGTHAGQARLRVLGRHDDLGRIGAVCAEEHDGIADAEAVDLCSDRGDHTGGVGAEAARTGQRVGRAPTRPHLPLDGVHTGRLDPHRDLARARNRVRHIDEGEDLGSADFRVRDRSGHGGGNLSVRGGYSRSDFWIRCSDTGSAVPRCWANRLTRYSSRSQRVRTTASGASAEGGIAPPASA